MAINKRLIKSNDEGGVGASFNTVTYTGNSTNDFSTALTQSVTGVGFEPDFVWIKNRNSTYPHGLFDNVRGATKLLQSMSNGQEIQSDGYLKSFDTDGFGLGGDYAFNRSGYTYVAWCWKAGGAAVTNTDGTITSQVSANTEAGFSIVTWTGNGISGASVGHGLNSVPNIIITKDRTLAKNWNVYSSAIGNDRIILLNTDQSSTIGDNYNNTTPTNEVFYNHAGNPAFGSQQNILNDLYVSYCFAEVAGFSKFGSYVGNGGTQSISLGFEPAFIIFKRTDSTGDWFIYDNKRDTTDPRTVGLYANLSAAEYNTSGSPGYADINFLSNGFSMNASYVGINGSGGTFIYMAFANQF